MNSLLKQLPELFTLQSMGEDLFLGHNQDLGGSRVFGGQVVAQALAAAGQTVEGRSDHSLHAYFLRVGDLAVPIEYKVDRVRDGRSFSLRHIVASQSGRAIFNMFASFQVVENGLDHQCQMPEVAGPEALTGFQAPGKERAEDGSHRGRQRSRNEMRIELLPVPHSEQAADRNRRSCKYLWFRVLDALPDSALMHQCAVAYASDFGLLGTARESHGIGFRQRNVQVASLDHAIWFHRDFRCNDWFLHAMECPSTSNTRGYARGQIFSRDGTLVASVAQEGMIRLQSELTTAD